MGTIRIRFERDPSLDQMEVVVRAAREDEQVKRWMDRLTELTERSLSLHDEYGRVQTVPVAEVVLVSVSGRTVTVHTRSRNYYAKTTLQRLEQELDPHLFVRISRYELVNLKMVRHYDFTGSGALRLELRTGRSVYASRRCIPTIRRALAGKE